jgi:hypothetical protein
MSGSGLLRLSQDGGSKKKFARCRLTESYMGYTPARKEASVKAKKAKSKAAAESIHS